MILGLLKKYWRLVILIGIILFAIEPTVDLDLGWHLRQGQYFWQTGQVLRDNIISFVWPDYKWVQNSWAFDVLLFPVFSLVGFTGLSIISGLITAVTFLTATWPMKRFNFWQLLSLALIFLLLTPPLYANGLRAQEVSSVFFALAVVTFFRDRKFLKFLPLLFFVWANIHGGFTLGLIVLGVSWITEGVLVFIKLSGKSAWVKTGRILFLSALTPVLNPWGLALYQESFKHSTNTNLAVINEWQPLWTDPVIAGTMLALVLAIGIICLVRKKSTDLPFLVGFLVVTVLALSALRFIIPFGIMVTFFLAQAVAEFSWASVPKRVASWRKAIPILLTAFVLLYVGLDVYVTKRLLPLPTLQVWGMGWKTYCELINECSEEVTAVMLQNPPSGNGYNPYNYGGYLSWRVPKVKTFVDGRMAAWERDGQTPPVAEGDRVQSGRFSVLSFRLFDSEYHFNWAIVHSDSAVVPYLEDLVKSGEWVRLYHDDNFNYYAKKTR